MGQHTIKILKKWLNISKSFFLKVAGTGLHFLPKEGIDERHASGDKLWYSDLIESSQGMKLKDMD